MPPVNQPQNIGDILADLQRRIRVLESAPQLGSSAINAGALTVTDLAGNAVVVAGLLPNGSYGLQVQSDPGGPGVTFLADGQGAALPFVIAPARSTASAGANSTTSTTMFPLWRTELELIQWDAVRVRVPWQTGASAGSLRIAVQSSGLSSSTVTLPANSSGTQDFHWLHGVVLNVGPVYFEVQAATSNAANAVFVWPPDGGFTFYRGGLMVPEATVAGV